MDRGKRKKPILVLQVIKIKLLYLKKVKYMSRAAAEKGPLSRTGTSGSRKELQSLERKMVTAQKRVDALRASLLEADPTDFVKLGDIQTQVDGAQAQLEAHEAAWLEVSERLEG